MRFLRETIVTYTCTLRCGYHRSVIETTLSLFHLIVTATAAVALWVLSFREHFPRYYLVSILAGEVWLLFVAGLALSVLLFGFMAADLME